MDTAKMIEGILDRADAQLDELCADVVDRAALHLLSLEGFDFVKGAAAAVVLFRQELDAVLPNANEADRSRATERFALGLAAKLEALTAATTPGGTVGRA